MLDDEECSTDFHSCCLSKTLQFRRQYVGYDPANANVFRHSFADRPREINFIVSGEIKTN
jgi:hypothetical protein